MVDILLKLNIEKTLFDLSEVIELFKIIFYRNSKKIELNMSQLVKI